MDDIEAKLDVLIEMYKADRQTGAAPGDDAAPSTSSSLRLAHAPADPRGDPESSTPIQPGAASSQSLRRGRPSRPMLRNLSDLGPRVAGRSTVSARLASTESPPPPPPPLPAAADGDPGAPSDRSPAASTPSSRRHPSIICESNDEQSPLPPPPPRYDDVSVELLPLPVADDHRDEARGAANHVAPQQFAADHVTASSNAIGRTVSPSDNSQAVVVL